MSFYTRQPEKAIAKCEQPGCKWIRIYFRKTPLDSWSPADRAAMGLTIHIVKKHSQGEKP